ncbi:Ig-like domain-containing protein [Pseudorhodoferax sp. Leaf274]|uniref:Ig-like domain-containing protein n=1 Tax=Pseudorhodoferax sp. Leaf274 TaxID=1736318 RepID=UPI0007024797|nr:Ig-like domain-containing protein [Pseudorhodoferax sp. Leaf274]KQP37999.1 hypothetical protein ASF44_12335 [Pseudorhodoferax sp. Leaf274]
MAHPHPDPASRPPFRRLGLGALVLGAALALAACGGGDGEPAALGAPTLAFVSPKQSLDLANYTLARRVTLPVNAAAGANQIAMEVSAVTYNETTDSLFIIGDEGTYITQLSKAGAVIDTMDLPPGLFADPEGLAWAGGNSFVVANERERTASLVAYTAGTVLDAGSVRTVKLGATVGNIGLEGVTRDPMTGGYIFVKEMTEQAVFQTTIDFTAGTASNGSATTGSPTTASSVNLFDPSLMRLADIADVHALSNSVAASVPDHAHLLVLGQEDGRILKVDRAGRIYSRLDLPNAPNLGHEGLTLDRQLNLYVTNETGGGSPSRPQLWVYTPTRSAAQVGLSSNLYLSFTDSVAAGTGNITVVGSNGETRTIAVTDATQVSIEGNTVRIDLAADLSPSTRYSVQYAAGVFKDSAGVPTQAVGSDQTLAFTSVADTTAPVLQASLPAANASGVLLGADIVLEFSEAVRAGAGSFTITNGSSDVRTIPAGDTTQVRFSGSTVTLNPATDLQAGTAYSVQVSATAVQDAAGNAFEGIADSTSLGFGTEGTAATPPPTLLISEVNSNATGGVDFFEVFNHGSSPATLSGWKWDDNSASVTEGAPIPTVTIPAQGRLVVAIGTDTAAFLAAWGLPASPLIVASDGPGLGASGDAVVLFDANNQVMASFNYGTAAIAVAGSSAVVPQSQASAGVTAAYGNHAGLVFGGNNASSAVWDGVSTSAPTYRVAVVGVNGGFAQPGSPTSIGSPGR